VTALRRGWIAAAAIGALWSATAAVFAAILLSLATGAEAQPTLSASALAGAVAGVAGLLTLRPWGRAGWTLSAVGLAGLLLFSFGRPFALPIGTAQPVHGIALLALAAAIGLPLSRILRDLPAGPLDRHAFERAVIRFLAPWGGLVFAALVAIPFFIMVMTSFKSQQELLVNPLDYSIDLGKGWELFRSYKELFLDFNFGRYLLISAFVSLSSVIVTLLFSVPGAYAVARLRFQGRSWMSRSILLIYMVPLIVLALPIYVAFSVTGLRNSLIGILLIYPVTTIPVALYMLQGYFRGLPAEVEEAGLMDGLSRLGVIWKITVPLALPAMASVSLYVFMIAWNEFLLAFMLLDDPAIFTLTRGVATLNSSEIPRQHLMAGSVIATVPVMLLFLALERFLTRGLTAGAVKG